MATTVELNDGRVLIRAPDAEKTAGGLFIVGPQQEPAKVGHVVSAGQPRTGPDGKPTSMQFGRGDAVLFSPLGATKLKVDGEELYLVRHEDVVGRVHGGA